jgi:hypothetical protein
LGGYHAQTSKVRGLSRNPPENHDSARTR